jgi:hypothetical protein
MAVVQEDRRSPLHTPILPLREEQAEIMPP